jgi:glycosyltransferase involved in cell wall biosynthesis
LASVLFAHPNFPAQFRALATSLGATGSHDVRFLTKTPRPEWEIPGVSKLIYQPADVPAGTGVHPYLASTQQAVQAGQAAFERCLQLRREGYQPDLIVGHSGWGQTMFLRDLFPEARMIGFFEWYFEPRGYAFRSTVHDPDVGADLSFHDALRARVANTPILQDLVAVDAGVCPTQWQRNQFPAEFIPKLRVIHEGIDTEFFQPAGDPALPALLRSELGLPPDCRLLTYTSRALEPMRGFPSFLRAAALALRQRADLQVVIVADDSRVCYGATRPDGLSYREHMQRELAHEADWQRIHFLPPRNYANYLRLLQASDCHVYLTKPYVLSWSFLEVLACATPMVASATPPVQEVVGMDDTFCSQVDFWDPRAIAEAALAILEAPEPARLRAARARAHVCEHYSVAHGLAAWNQLMKELLFT